MNRLRSGGKFALTVLGFSAVGYYGYNMYQEQKFLHPTIAESVSTVSGNKDIKELMGFPLSYQSTFKNRVKAEGNEVRYYFQVMSPRGNMDVELTVDFKTVQEIYHPKEELRITADIEETLNKI